ncbi:hypothetical protein OIU79_000456 [Salix purpurea]|uniref:Uncharacterized protein n=1 Tax=Salix purpurea TaxID=77065 RepID=A0A9Q0V239_SALPP|nr:hypothetical protein OIU79_000456 [Salix purpurea]
MREFGPSSPREKTFEPNRGRFFSRLLPRFRFSFFRLGADITNARKTLRCI